MNMGEQPHYLRRSISSQKSKYTVLRLFLLQPTVMTSNFYVSYILYCLAGDSGETPGKKSGEKSDRDDWGVESPFLWWKASESGAFHFRKKSNKVVHMIEVSNIMHEMEKWKLSPPPLPLLLEYPAHTQKQVFYTSNRYFTSQAYISFLKLRKSKYFWEK